VSKQSGVELIAAERLRQKEQEGWSHEHDDGHVDHELALAAACYAAPDRAYIGSASGESVELRDMWPWEARDDKRSKHLVRCWFAGPLAKVLLSRGEVREARIQELIKAGSLIAAEIDRLQRVADVEPS
jgi:hypothetical protein